MEALREDWILDHLSSLGGGRYYYAPNVMLFLALLSAAQPSWQQPWKDFHLFHALSSVLIALVLVVGIQDYMTGNKRYPMFFTGPSWPAEVQQWERGEKDYFEIWPIPWRMKAP